MKKLRVGLIGCGTIGNILARAIDNWEYYQLVVIFDIKMEAAKKLHERMKKKPKIAHDFGEFLKEDKDLVVEAAFYNAVKDYSRKILETSDLMVMSTAAFVIYPELYSQLGRIAREKGRKIYLPSGAIVGIDGVRSAKGEIEEVTLITTKNPKSIEQTEYLTNKGIYLEDLKNRTVIFKGSAKEASSYFPKNLNVASTLSFSGIGVEKTKVVLVADPAIKENKHEILVRGAFGEFRTQAKNIPSPGNPKTSYLAALSAIATLHKINEPFQIGT
ncbi:MAG: aspartate dehydrogenase [Candidatus Methylarchaceae archaeon HK02M1]|nr:aspartate dehydrogenase [Candidatus Methylarchaceae archaeon HK01M]MCP8312310.1 aspartate dehydrogenase [Candidatus Methylarchaceae archaeon HK02M1]